MQTVLENGTQDALKMRIFTCCLCGCRFKGAWKDTIDPHIVGIAAGRITVEYAAVCPYCTVRTTDRVDVYL